MRTGGDVADAGAADPSAIHDAMRDVMHDAMHDAVATGVDFDASAESIAQARRLIASQLESWNLGQLGDDARLVASELLTNAVLHARPPVHVRLARLPQGVRLEVSDGSVELPLRVHASTEVMTGRGWALVESLCQEWGVEPSGEGKVVWVTLQDRSHKDSGVASGDSRTMKADLLELAQARPPDPLEQRYEVSLGDVPTALLIDAKAHVDAVMREFALLASGVAAGKRYVPVELSDLIERVVRNFSEARQSIKRQALRAVEQHQPRTELTLFLPVSAADAGLAYLAALDEVDAYCRAAQMLTLETPPAHRLFRRWYVGELVAGLRRAAHPEAYPQREPETFESRLLREFGQGTEPAQPT